MPYAKAYAHRAFFFIGSASEGAGARQRGLGGGGAADGAGRRGAKWKGRGVPEQQRVRSGPEPL